MTSTTSENLFRSVIAAMAEGVVVMDQNGAFVSCNPSAERILGLDADQIMGRTTMDPRWGAIHEDYSPFPGETHPIMVTLRTGQPQKNVIMGIQKSTGELTWLSINTQPLIHSARGVPQGAVASFSDITEERRVHKELQDMAQRLQTLSRRLLEIQEEQARELARELHDEIGQLLTGLKLTLESMSQGSTREWMDQFQTAQKIIQELIGGVRGLAMGLRPTMLDDLGLLATLQWHFQRYTTHTGVRVLFHHQGLETRLPSEVETAAYRIVQEALTNVARYAEVDRVQVDIWKDQQTLHLRIQDQGKGFHPGEVLSKQKTVGLSGMRERAELLGGEWFLASHPGAGTRLSAALPIPSAEKRAPSCP
jgi:PAS domain S-box-containing protein